MEGSKKSGEEYAIEDLYSCPEQLPFVQDCPNIKDKYQIGKYIGKGAYSVVKVAQDKVTDEFCALKIIQKEGLTKL